MGLKRQVRKQNDISLIPSPREYQTGTSQALTSVAKGSDDSLRYELMSRLRNSRCAMANDWKYFIDLLMLLVFGFQGFQGIGMGGRFEGDERLGQPGPPPLVRRTNLVEALAASSMLPKNSFR